MHGGTRIEHDMIDHTGMFRPRALLSMDARKTEPAKRANSQVRRWSRMKDGPGGSLDRGEGMVIRIVRKGPHPEERLIYNTCQRARGPALKPNSGEDCIMEGGDTHLLIDGNFALDGGGSKDSPTRSGLQHAGIWPEHGCSTIECRRTLSYPKWISQPKPEVSRRQRRFLDRRVRISWKAEIGRTPWGCTYGKRKQDRSISADTRNGILLPAVNGMDRDRLRFRL